MVEGGEQIFRTTGRVPIVSVVYRGGRRVEVRIVDVGELGRTLKPTWGPYFR